MCAASVVLLFLFLSSITSAAAEETNSHISLSSSLTPINNPSWFSSSGTFAFGFYHTPNGYAVCISFSSYLDRSSTVVWTANTEDPIVPNNVVLLLTEGGLVLQNSVSKETLSKIGNSSQPIAGASMLDNGNFVLLNSRGSVVWQTIDHLTNSLLPGHRLSPGAQLLSHASETDLKKGFFRLKMQTDGNLVLYDSDSLDVSEDAYYASRTDGRGNNISLNLESDGHLYLFDGTSIVMNITMGGNPASGVLYLVRIDADGIFRVYNRSLQRQDDWRSIWSVTEDRCLPKGLCGINSYCRYKDGNAADCRCLPGYDPIGSVVWGAGCTAKLVVDCSDKDQSSKFMMTRIQNVTWEDNYYSVLDGSSEQGCEEACLKDCSCHVALFRDGQCRKQKLPLRYGRWLKVEDVAFVRVSKSSTGSSWPLRHKRRHFDLHVILGVSSGTVGLLILSFVIIYSTRRRRRWRKEDKLKMEKFLLKHQSLAPKRYSCKQLKKITKCFRDELGRGAFGIVYKGKLSDGQLVAVKVLKESHDNAEEFINEVVSISRTSHVNIVNLLGFCYHRNKRALLYEFMPNKSLDKFICKGGSTLEWKILYEVAVGVARGLEYLHRGCNTRIVHFDIKPQNILLDQDFCPKISDFGLAKLCMKKQSAISMLGTRGTVGYIAPEVFSRNFGVASHKSDVYSYGIMLLHMVGSKYVEMVSDIYFWDKVYERVLMQNERVDDLVTEEEEESARKMLMVGFWCIQTSPMERPSISKAVEMLEGKLQSIHIPPRPFLLSSPPPQISSFISCNCRCAKLDSNSHPTPCSCLVANIKTNG
ncbi:G-type lectin S-receptor-like serine/threonine-protein kinase LECRK2 [Salvia miltiorrhiza]|uniref:G-type lectin S-receptor-like serine/threonine-protein kinase LECRK2 n=1 Tax=Salvia miltiorrhiza TaxID=226208 RepID=UPI0025AD3834|nr:G-type lectin S-receptor-like serine/threonine-protein kinase LECRK2 [Salvia miltiorrhiza]